MLVETLRATKMMVKRTMSRREGLCNARWATMRAGKNQDELDTALVPTLQLPNPSAFLLVRH